MIVTKNKQEQILRYVALLLAGCFPVAVGASVHYDYYNIKPFEIGIIAVIIFGVYVIVRAVIKITGVFLVDDDVDTDTDDDKKKDP